MLNENDRYQTINSTSPPMLALCIRGCLTELIVYLSIYWVDAKVSADLKKNVFKRCSATMDAWFSCI